MLYPLIFKPIYKEMIWGGTRLATMFGRELPSDKVGESWDISCRPLEMGIIENGPCAGLGFDEYININRRAVLGTRLENCDRFPLLVKIIDANDVLSIQVHPDDAYAAQKGGADCGKNEMWYVLAPPDDGYLLIGLRPDITKEKLQKAYSNGTVENCMARLPVKAGDIIDIPAGLVHALTPGVMVAEVQQNSDITYRLFDFDRLDLHGNPRPLHIDDAFAVTDFDNRLPKSVVMGQSIKKGENELIYAINNPYFAIIKYILAGSITEESDPGAFSIFTCVEGRAAITVGEFVTKIPAGRSVFIPAGMRGYTIAPDESFERTVLLKSFVPPGPKSKI